jgi:hypothetical protein
MTIPSSGTITSADVAAEIGYPIVIPDTETRNLTGRSSGSITWPDDFYGQTGGGDCSLTDISAFDDTSAGTATITAVQFGATAWNRYIVCPVLWSCTLNDVSTTILSATIGGASAIALVQNANNGTSAFTNYGVAIIRALVPTGSSGTVVINFSNGTVRRCYISAYRVTGWASGTAFDTATGYDESLLGPGASKPSAQSTCSVPSNGALFVVGQYSCGTDTSSGLTFTGATERADSNGAFDDRLGHAFNFPLSSQTNRPVGVAATSFIDSSRARMCAASFQLA